MGERITREWGIGDPSINVVGERFCNPYPMELTVKREENLKRDRYDVVDSSGNLLLHVDGSIWDVRHHRLMRDPAGLPVLTMRSKAMSMKYKWEVYEGESSDSQHLLFFAQEPKIFSLKSSIDIFLPYNSINKASDFQAVGTNLGCSFKVFKANALLAEVTYSFSWGKVGKGSYSLKVKVSPEVDYAFIVALVVIMDDINNSR